MAVHERDRTFVRIKGGTVLDIRALFSKWREGLFLFSGKADSFVSKSIEGYVCSNAELNGREGHQMIGGIHYGRRD